ncbi:MAG: HmuY family protein [Candidatus Competibacteraceae bacterium]|nr:HmuY family protein [Candidatus Competibacteraceae bacterium]
MRNHIIHIIVVFTFSIIHTACFQEDEPLQPYVSPPGITTNVASMGPLYDKQLFYDLETDSFISVVHRESWDIAFSSASNQHAIFINSSKLMKVAHTGSTDYSQTYSTSGLEWQYDHSSGWPDSTAIGSWGSPNDQNIMSHQFVYLIDRGFSTSGSNIGIKKLQILSLNNQTYTIRFANLDGSQEQTIQISKDPAYNFVFLSFDQGQVQVEPPKHSWDLVFTQYTTRVLQQSTGIVENYSVNGVLLNPYQVEACRSFDKPYSQLMYSDIGQYTFTQQRDIIGYDWKTFDFNLSAYTIEPNNSYMIKEVEGFYYKFRFISFTNEQGIKGYPKFEVGRF